MTFYQELQLNQAGSKSLIKNCKTPKEKLHHLFIYIFKVFINVAFCVAFVTAYSMIFGNDNSIVGVVILLCILVFRNVDLGIHAPQSLLSLSAIFLILTFGPKAANLLGAFGGLLILCMHMDSYGTGMPQRNLLQSFNPCARISSSLWI